MPDPSPQEDPAVLKQPEAKVVPPKPSRSFISRITGWLNGLYLIVFFGLIALLSWWGERFSLLSLLLFAPAYLLLAPLAVLTPLCLFVRPRLVLGHIFCTLVLAFGYMEFTWVRKPSPAAYSLKVVTFNAGDGDRSQFMQFVGAHDPDLIILQDVGTRGANYANTWTDRYVSGRGEFLLVSRDPVRETAFVQEPNWDGRPIAARFEVDGRQGPLVVYNVHMPTPRRELKPFLSRRVIGSLIKDADHGKTFSSYREWVDARIEMAQQFAAVLARETQPFIVCGDFNTPDHGYIHRIHAGQMADAHERAGRGWGLTFPGGTGGRAARLGPWLRIDYAYAGRGWTPVYCETDSGRRSQHRAVAAYFASTPARR